MNTQTTKQIMFFAEGLPKGQPRPRAFSRNGRANVYDPGTAEGWKSAVAMAARGHISRQDAFVGAVGVALYFFFPRPKSHFNSRGELKSASPKLHISKPDADNLAKAVLDALTQLGAWRDDAQVTELTVKKFYSPTGAASGCRIIMKSAQESEVIQ